MIILEPCAGLGNRLLALASAHELCEEMNRELVVIWKREAGCNAKAADLFDFAGVRVIEISENGYKKELFGTIKGNLTKKKYRSRGTAFFPCDKIDQYKQQGRFAELREEIAREPALYIKSYTNLCELGKESFSFIRPSAAVSEKGRDVFSRIGAKTIGVHIRRTDHAEAIKNSPLELFFDRMRQEIAEHDADFYVTTDDREVEQALKEAFPENRLILYEGKRIDRDSKEGIEDALIDMLALSKCSRILGSYQSTFSLIPSMMGGIPLETMVKG